MEIKTKYSIGNIITHKFGRGNRELGPSSMTMRYEVLFIDINTCSAGSQIFYTCRPIFIERLIVGYGEEKREVISVFPVDGQDVSKCKFREDEVVDCDAESIALISAITNN